MTIGDAPSPQWVRPTLEIKEGRDPLGLQTTTQDRLTPLLLPGVLELSRRARYFSFHAYFLHRYRELALPPEPAALSSFIKRREWEFGLAVLKCPHKCGSSPVGALSLRQVVNNQDPPYPRGESVESQLGGYGLYYRSPMSELGVVARAGTLLGDTPIPVDVLRDTERARALVAGFGAAIEATSYGQNWMLSQDNIPLDVLVDYADNCCLCQLVNHADERAAIVDALFGEDAEPDDTNTDTVNAEPAGTDAPPAPDDRSAVRQRRASFAHYLTLLDAKPDVVKDESAYRQAIWDPPTKTSGEQARVAGLWAGLIAKDVWQDALCSIWSEFIRTGLAVTERRGGVGLTWDETKSLAMSMTGGPPLLEPTQQTNELAAAIEAGNLRYAELGNRPVNELTLEQLRVATDSADTATSGLIVVVELLRRTRDRTDDGWALSSRARSAWQPSVASVLDQLVSHLEKDPTVADTLWWLVENFVISVHERIAYSKLPEHTFRFRWEEGRIRFYDNGIGRFPLAAIRREPLASLTEDLGFWTNEGSDPSLTAAGRSFVQDTFS